MNKHEIKKLVEENYNQGYHCAESIVNTTLKVFSIDDEFVCKYSSGFCGGVGKCKKDICGALSGGIIALGAIYGRKNGGEDISKLVEISAELRRQFINEFGSTVCENVIEDIERKGKLDCRDVTAITTTLLHDLLIEHDVKKNELVVGF